MPFVRPCLLILALTVSSLGTGCASAGDSANHPPKLVHGTPPDYPADMQAAGMEGEVVLRFVVGTDGNVSQASIVSSTDVRFERAALQAVYRWKFRPAAVNGQATPMTIQAPVEFRLTNDVSRLRMDQPKYPEPDPGY